MEYLTKTIGNTIENDMMIPMYMNKAKVSQEQIGELIANETWFNGNEKDEMFIGNFFNINYLDQAKEVTASVSKNLFKNYKHIPKALKDVEEDEGEPKQQEEVVEKVEEPIEEVVEVPMEEKKEEEIDYSTYENKISSLKREV